MAPLMPARLLTLLPRLLLPNSSAQVLTAQYDNARTGDMLHQTAQTPANVNTAPA